ncbi:MAG: trans-sulfuration enzyme family protein [Nitrospinota bacterium]
MKYRSKKTKRFFTKAVHSGEWLDPLSGSISVPIYQTSTFALRNAEQGAAIFAGEEEGYVYGRLGNPTQKALEDKVAALEGGEACLAFASGMAAISTLLLHLLQKGDHIVSSDTIYGGTHSLFDQFLHRVGIGVSYADGADLGALLRAMTPKTKALFIETPSNPTLKLVDIRGACDLARGRRLSLIVDNTFATPYFQRPIEFGADIVVHSATKYIGGHGDTVAGLVVGDKTLISAMRNGSLRDLGGIISPFNAWLLLRGLKTLPLRMEKHSANAIEVARFLEHHPKVERVFYPGLTSHPQHRLAKGQMDGFGGMVSFEVVGGKEAGRLLMNSVRLCILAVSLGDVDTLISHPASMTHSSYTEEECRRVGITPGLIRLSVGIEDPADIIGDLDQALAKI